MSERKRNNKKQVRRGKRRKNAGFSRALVTEASVHRFRMVDNTTSGLALTTNGSGVCAGYINGDPSGAGSWTASEWSQLSALYSEIRLISLRVHFIFGPSTDTKFGGTSPGNSFYVSSTQNTIGASPTTSATVFDNADAKVYTIFNTQRSPIVHTLMPRRRLNYAVVTTPNPGSYAGCPGGIQFFADQLPLSVTLGYAKIEGIYEFTSRI